MNDPWLDRASMKYLDMGMFFSKAQMIADCGHFLQVNIPISSHISLLWWLRVGKKPATWDKQNKQDLNKNSSPLSSPQKRGTRLKS